MTVYNGTSGNDAFSGNGDNDVLNGWGGNDVVYGFGGNDKVNGNAGNDKLFGGDGRDTVSGGDGADTLYGNDGNDRLVGGPGNDVYYGGDGLDTFVFTDVPGGSIAAHETIKDYGFGEILDLSQIDANRNVAGNQAFRFIGRADEFTGRAGEARIELHGDGGFSDYTTVHLDVDGDKTTDMIIRVDGFRINFRADDFIL